MSSVEIKGIAELRAGLKEINDLVASGKPMQGMVDDIKLRIRVRTHSGVDYQGQSFAPYSEAYKKKIGGTRVDLTRTGTMLNSMVSEVLSPAHGVVRVNPTSEPGGHINSDLLANIHNQGTGKMPQREFVNITPNAVAEFKKKNYDDPLGEIVRKLR